MNAMAQAARALYTGHVGAPLRSFTPLAGERGVLAMMPAAAADPPVFGIKTLSLLPANPAEGRPAIQGLIALFNHHTGAPCAIIDGASVTAIRTAAASGLATRTLAKKGARTHGILGTGVQSLSHAEAVLTACPQLQETRIWGRDFNKAKAAANRLQEALKSPVVAVEDRANATRCDVVSAVTASPTPLIEHSNVCPGAHINLVGSHTPNKREACSQTMAQARLYVDGREAALSEAGDIVIPLAEGVINHDHIIAELGAVLSGEAQGRTTPDDITVYKSLGNAAQDLFAAWTLYCHAKQAGTGQQLAM